MDLKSVGYKASGIHGRFKAVGSIITGIILIILGIVISITTASFNALILSLFGIIALVYGYFLWKRCASLLKGEFR